MSRGFFNPSVPFQPPPQNAEGLFLRAFQLIPLNLVNWAVLAQRWMSEHGNNEPLYPNSGNCYRNQGLPQPQNPQQQFGSRYNSNF
jgi:hypothetical protein